MNPTNAQKPEVVEIAPVNTAVIAGVVRMDELADFFDRSFGAIAGAIAQQGVTMTGPAFALYHGAPADTVRLEVGFPTDAAVAPDGDVRAGRLPGGRVVRLVHEGSYDRLSDSWGRLRSFMEANGYTPGTKIWEVYVTEPSPDMDPADLKTELYWPIEP